MIPMTRANESSRFRSSYLLGALILAAPLGCTQHSSELDTEEPDEVVQTRTVEAAARPMGKRTPRRCTAMATEAFDFDEAGGTDRGLLRVATDDGIKEIPLQETTIDSHVVGTVAETMVTQVFANPFDEPIEAIYTFPLDDDAAVDDYWIHVGDRSIHGIMKRRAEAKKIYEKAKKEGRSAALMEQERTNIFTQSVANIMPGETIEVQMHVVQPLEQEDGRYALVFPTVVGPRYVPGKPKRGARGKGRLPDTDQVPDASRISPPILPEGADSCSPVAISVDIETGMGLADVKSKNHRVAVTEANDIATVELENDVAIPNRDFVLSWDIERDSPEGSFMMQRDEEGKGGYFTLTLEPPDALRPEAAVPRDLVFVIDNSGSMHGQPMDVARMTVRTAVKKLNPDDTFQIMRFSETASAMSSKPLANSPGNRKRGINYINQMSGMGGTNMIEGIKAALSAPSTKGRMPIVMFLTDGYIGNERQIFEAVSQTIGDSRIFSVGVGGSPNRHLLNGLAKNGRGSAFYVGLDDKKLPAVDSFYSKIAYPALSDVEIDWGDLEVEDVVPSRIPDLFVGQPVVVYGRFKGTPRGNVKVRGRLGKKDVALPISLNFANESGGNEGTGLASMWARTKIEELIRDPEVYLLDEDEVKKRTEQATELALEYSVLTEKTAFVAVDSKMIVNPDGTTRTEVVEVELPEGMDRSAVGGEADAWGAGGLGIVGTGRGGGGTGEGTIGLGNTGLIGKGGGGGSGSGYGRGSGAGFGGRGKRIPKVRQAKAVVTGSLDKNIIRRIVRSHINEVRACYNDGLSNDPSLKGRVAVSFVINPDGTVKASVVQSSTLPESAKGVNECIAKAVKKWKFPSVDGDGVVTVTYPFVLSPG